MFQWLSNWYRVILINYHHSLLLYIKNIYFLHWIASSFLAAILRRHQEQTSKLIYIMLSRDLFWILVSYFEGLRLAVLWVSWILVTFFIWLFIFRKFFKYIFCFYFLFFIIFVLIFILFIFYFLLLFFLALLGSIFLNNAIFSDTDNEHEHDNLDNMITHENSHSNPFFLAFHLLISSSHCYESMNRWDPASKKSELRVPS